MLGHADRDRRQLGHLTPPRLDGIDALALGERARTRPAALGPMLNDLVDLLGRKQPPVPALVPLLAAIGQLIPWLKQWHNEPDMSFGGTRMGHYFEEYLAQEAKAIGQSVEQVMAWTPPEKVKKAGRRKVSE